MFVQSGRSFHSIDINRKACGNDCFWDKWGWWMNWTWRREWTDSVLWHHRLKQDASGSIMLNWCEMMKYEIRTRDANKCFKAAQFFPARLLKKSLFLIRSQSGEVLFCKQSFLKVINCYHISAIFIKLCVLPWFITNLYRVQYRLRTFPLKPSKVKAKCFTLICEDLENSWFFLPHTGRRSSTACA